MIFQNLFYQLDGAPQNSHSFDNDIKKEDIQRILITLWNDFCDNIDHYNCPQQIHRMLSKLVSREEGNEWTQLDDAPTGFDIHEMENNQEFLQIFRVALLGENHYDPNIVEWSCNHNFSNYQQIYIHTDNNLLNTELIMKDRYNHISNEEVQIIRNIIVPNNIPFNDMQKVAYDICAAAFQNTIRCFHTSQLPINNHILTLGIAGSGKTFLIQQLENRYNYGNEYDLHNPHNTSSKAIVLCAPTGKAASGIGGQTQYSIFHLSVNTHFEPLQGDALNLLKSTFENTIMIIMDEFTMNDGVNLHRIDLRCRQAKNRDIPFGGMALLLVGDPAQLPPVQGKPLWFKWAIPNNQRKQNHNLGNLLFTNFTDVILLVESNRLDPNDVFENPITGEYINYYHPFKSLLDRARNGYNTIEDHILLTTVCSSGAHQIRRNMNDKQCEEFIYSNNATWYYNTNEEILQHNIKMIRSLNINYNTFNDNDINNINNMPIIRVNSINTEHQKNATEENTRHLTNISYFCVGAKVVLNWNLNVPHGLVNGATGVIRDFIFHNIDNASGIIINHETKVIKQPTAINIDFPTYSGSSFFTDETKSKWIPIFPQVAKWSNGNSLSTHKAFPLQLTWA